MARRLTGMDIFDVLLRVPPVFLMDVSMNYWTWSSSSSSGAVIGTKVAGSDAGNAAQQQEQQPVGYLEEDDELDWDLTSLSEASVRILGVMSALIMFVLRTNYLLRTYRWLASVGCIVGCHHIYNAALLTTDQGPTTISNMSVHVLLQCLLAAIFITQCKLCWNSSMSHKFLIAFAFVTPTLMTAGRHLYTPPILTPYVALLVLTAQPMAEVILHAGLLGRLAKRALFRARIIARHHGLPLLLEAEWTRLLVPHVLRVFWLARFCEQMVLQSWSDRERDRVVTATTMSGESLAEASKQLLVKGCDTVVAVLGLTSVVSTLAHHLGCAVQRFLMIQDDDENSFGTVSAILFFMLALQTGLTGLEPDKRFVRLYRNFCLLFTAILHFVHNMVNPVLMSLSASRNRSWTHHGRALILCAFLVAFPSWFLVYLWRTHQVSTWLLAVSAFSVEVTVRVVISLLVYALFMWDAYKNTFWERLDDYVYYVRATGNTVEFLFGIFLFFNGAWILLFESGGTIRACMMCIHAYFNIWVQAKLGWKVFIRRRCAVNKINNSTTEATAEQLRRLQDVCAICYQEMASARITWCGHFFHALCLRKWLYIQDRCPMCHKTLYKMDDDDGGAGGAEGGGGDGRDGMDNNGGENDQDDDFDDEVDVLQEDNLDDGDESNGLQIVARQNHPHQD